MNELKTFEWNTDDFKIDNINDWHKIFTEDRSFHQELHDKLYSNLFKIFINSCFFSFFPPDFTMTYNHRTTFFIANFIKDYIVDKHFCHIGGASGDLELLLSKYAKKITIIEVDSNRIKDAIHKKKNSLYSCPVEIIHGNFFHTKIEADVYFTWCGQGSDYDIIKHVIQNYNNSKIISLCIPYYFYKNYNLRNIMV